MRPCAVARVGQIFVGEEVAHPLQRRDRRWSVSDWRIFGGQPRPVGRRDRRREVLDRAPVRRILGLLLELVVELLDHVADGQLGVDDAFGLALLPLRGSPRRRWRRSRGCASDCSHSPRPS